MSKSNHSGFSGAETIDVSVIANLLEVALSAFDGDRNAAKRCIEQAYSLANASKPERGAVRGALAAWQARRVEDYIDGNLGASLRIEDAAAIVRLSPSYFSRAFKVSFGQPFSHFVIHRRIERAKRLLLSTDASIAEISLECGLADQSHLTRLFSRAVGSPPNAWRRALQLNPGRLAAG